MSLPVIAVTNASTCLSDAQVEAVIPSLQRQVSLDFKAYWDGGKLFSRTIPTKPGRSAITR